MVGWSISLFSRGTQAVSAQLLTCSRMYCMYCMYCTLLSSSMTHVLSNLEQHLWPVLEDVMVLYTMQHHLVWDMDGQQPHRRLCCVRVCGLSSSNNSHCPLMNQPSSSGGCSSSVHQSRRHHHHHHSRPGSSSSATMSRKQKDVSQPKGGLHPESLLDLSAKIVAFYIPFARIEERYDRIPEPVQNRIIFWSFPRNERDICMYSTLSSSLSSSSSSSSESTQSTSSSSVTSCSGCIAGSQTEVQRLPFYRGLRLYEAGAVDSVLQVGFHLSGTVTVKSSTASNPTEEKKVRVSITFDRYVSCFSNSYYISVAKSYRFKPTTLVCLSCQSHVSDRYTSSQELWLCLPDARKRFSKDWEDAKQDE